MEWPCDDTGIEIKDLKDVTALTYYGKAAGDPGHSWQGVEWDDTSTQLEVQKQMAV